MYAPTSSRSRGDPYVIKTTPVRIALDGCRRVHRVDESLEQVGVGVRGDAVPEVEDVAGPPPSLSEHIAHPGVRHAPAGEDIDAVEVALNPLRVPHAPPGIVKAHPPIDA